jgi:hypothetical protein
VAPTCIGSFCSTLAPRSYAPFKVTQQNGGNLGGGAERVGDYTFDKLHNGVAAYSNGVYLLYYGGGGDGWQWTTGYNQWAGRGPILAEVASAEDFVHYSLFTLASDAVQDFASFEIVAQVGGNLGGGADRLGIYTYSKMFNGIPSYSNSKYILFYGSGTSGWQWVSGYNQWAGNGPSSNVITTAKKFVRYMQFQLASDEIAAVGDFEITAQVGGNLGGGADRLGVYVFDKMFNGVAAFKNDHYVVFYDGDRDGYGAGVDTETIRTLEAHAMRPTYSGTFKSAVVSSAYTPHWLVHICSPFYPCPFSRMLKVAMGECVQPVGRQGGFDCSGTIRTGFRQVATVSIGHRHFGRRPRL